MKRLLLLLAMLCVLPCRGEEKDTIRVLTFNLRYLNPGDAGARMWTQRRDAVAELIKNDQADFIGVQEAFRSMLDDVRARVPGYRELGAGREDGLQKGEYSAILFREAAWHAAESGTFWLSDTPDVPGSSTWGNTVTRICTWARFRHKVSGRELFVYNAHFDHQSQPSREKSAALIMQRIRDRGSEAPVLVTGDFNATPENPAVATILKGPPLMTDVWLSLNKAAGDAESGTFHDFSGRRDGGRIDYIFASPGLVPLEAAIMHDEKGGQYPSDHYPVRATLRLP